MIQDPNDQLPEFQARQTKFVIEFVWKPTAQELRPQVEPPPPEDSEESEDGESADANSGTPAYGT